MVEIHLVVFNYSKELRTAERGRPCALQLFLNLQNNRSPGPDGFAIEFYKVF